MSRPISPLLIVRSLVLIACFTLMLAGCSSKKAGEGDGTGGVSDEDLALQNQARFGDGNIPLAQAGGMFEDVHFDFDSAAISGINSDILRKNAETLKSNATVRVTLEGHCDRRGTNEYNMALGESRARSVAAMLVNMGVSAGRISTISYGEEIPLAQGDDESAYAQNRRVHFAAVGSAAR